MCMIATAARSDAEISGYNSDAVQYRRGTSKNPTDEQLRNAKQIQRCSTAATYRPESENRWGGATSTAASRALSKASPPTLHLKGRIQVIVRIRPIEQTAARTTTVLPDGKTLRTVPSPVKGGKDKLDQGRLRESWKELEVSFDRVLGESAGQGDVYDQVKACVRLPFAGVNTCVFAYGQTGSGKTHTMVGDMPKQGTYDAGPASATANGNTLGGLAYPGTRTKEHGAAKKAALEGRNSAESNNSNTGEVPRGESAGVIPRAVRDIFRLVRQGGAEEVGSPTPGGEQQGSLHRAPGIYGSGKAKPNLRAGIASPSSPCGPTSDQQTRSASSSGSGSSTSDPNTFPGGTSHSASSSRSSCSDGLPLPQVPSAAHWPLDEPTVYIPRTRSSKENNSSPSVYPVKRVIPPDSSESPDAAAGREEEHGGVEGLSNSAREACMTGATTVTSRCDVECSYMQVYNGRVYDLLSPEDSNEQRPLQVHATAARPATATKPCLRAHVRDNDSREVNDTERKSNANSTTAAGTRGYGSSSLPRECSASGSRVVGLSVHPVKNAEQVMELLRQGDRNRRVRSTEMNTHSSRSHTIVQFTITSTRSTAEPGVDPAPRLSSGGDTSEVGVVVADESQATTDQIRTVSQHPGEVSIGDGDGTVGKIAHGNHQQHSSSPHGSHSRSDGSTGVMMMMPEHQSETGSGNAVVTTRAKLSLVDLAGSEKGGPGTETVVAGGHKETRGSQSQRGLQLQGGLGPQGVPSQTQGESSWKAQERERSRINSSLSALSNCIACLGEARRTHVPFRDSPLTRLLQDSLVGGKTVVIATIRPSVDAQDESISTLNFAARCMRVVSRQRVNEVVSDALLLERARRQIATLRRRLAEAETAATVASYSPAPSHPHNDPEGGKQLPPEMWGMARPSPGVVETPRCPPPCPGGDGHNQDNDGCAERHTGTDGDAVRENDGKPDHRREPTPPAVHKTVAKQALSSGLAEQMVDLARGRAVVARVENGGRCSAPGRGGSDAARPEPQRVGGAYVSDGGDRRRKNSAVNAVWSVLKMEAVRRSEPERETLGDESRKRDGHIALGPSGPLTGSSLSPSQRQLPRSEVSLLRGKCVQAAPVVATESHSRRRRSGFAPVSTTAANEKTSDDREGHQAKTKALLNARRGRDLVVRGRIAISAAAAAATATAAAAVAEAVAASARNRSKHLRHGKSPDGRVAASQALPKGTERPKAPHRHVDGSCLTKADDKPAVSCNPRSPVSSGGLVRVDKKRSCAVSTVAGTTAGGGGRRHVDDKRLATAALIERFSCREDELLRELETWKARCKSLETSTETAGTSRAGQKPQHTQKRSGDFDGTNTTCSRRNRAVSPIQHLAPSPKVVPMTALSDPSKGDRAHGGHVAPGASGVGRAVASEGFNCRTEKDRCCEGGDRHSEHPPRGKNTSSVSPSSSLAESENKPLLRPPANEPVEHPAQGKNCAHRTPPPSRQREPFSARATADSTTGNTSKLEAEVPSPSTTDTNVIWNTPTSGSPTEAGPRPSTRTNPNPSTTEALIAASSTPSPVATGTDVSAPIDAANVQERGGSGNGGSRGRSDCERHGIVGCKLCCGRTSSFFGDGPSGSCLGFVLPAASKPLATAAASFSNTIMPDVDSSNTTRRGPHPLSAAQSVVSPSSNIVAGAGNGSDSNYNNNSTWKPPQPNLVPAHVAVGKWAPAGGSSSGGRCDRHLLSDCILCKMLSPTVSYGQKSPKALGGGESPTLGGGREGFAHQGVPGRSNSLPVLRYSTSKDWDGGGGGDGAVTNTNRISGVGDGNGIRRARASGNHPCERHELVACFLCGSGGRDSTTTREQDSFQLIGDARSPSSRLSVPSPHGGEIETGITTPSCAAAEQPLRSSGDTAFGFGVVDAAPLFSVAKNDEICSRRKGGLELSGHSIRFRAPLSGSDDASVGDDTVLTTKKSAVESTVSVCAGRAYDDSFDVGHGLFHSCRQLSRSANRQGRKSKKPPENDVVVGGSTVKSRESLARTNPAEVGAAEIVTRRISNATANVVIHRDRRKGSRGTPRQRARRPTPIGERTANNKDDSLRSFRSLSLRGGNTNRALGSQSRGSGPTSNTVASEIRARETENRTGDGLLAARAMAAALVVLQ